MTTVGRNKHTGYDMRGREADNETGRIKKMARLATENIKKALSAPIFVSLNKELAETPSLRIRTYIQELLPITICLSEILI